MAVGPAIDAKLVEQARKLGGHASKQEAIATALRQYIRSRRVRGLADLVGKVEYFDDYDYKAARKRALR